MLKNLVFDFDGVIADTHDINFALSLEHDETATYDDFLAHHDGNVFEEPRIKFNPERVHLFHSEYRKRLQPSHLANAIDPLTRLGNKYSLYIISSTDESSINGILERVNLSKFFKKVMGVNTHKSKAEKFKMLMAEDGITPENCLFITDTLGDIKEANTLNIKTIAETFGFHDRARLMQGNPFKIADSWAEIQNIIEEFE